MQQHGRQEGHHCQSNKTVKYYWWCQPRHALSQTWMVWHQSALVLRLLLWQTPTVRGGDAPSTETNFSVWFRVALWDHVCSFWSLTTSSATWSVCKLASFVEDMQLLLRTSEPSSHGLAQLYGSRRFWVSDRHLSEAIMGRGGEGVQK